MNPNPSSRLGGVIHTYRAYDPKNFPPPASPPPDVASSALEHMLRYGSMRRLTPEELARAVKIDPSQIQGLGPSLDALIAMLEERKRKILATYETDTVEQLAHSAFHGLAESMNPPAKVRKAFEREVKAEQLRDLEALWYKLDDEQSPFAGQLVRVVEKLGEKYQVETLVASYEFTGRTAMDVPKAIAIKEELEMIDRLLQQLKDARENAQIGVIDMDELAQFAEAGDLENLRGLQQQIENYLRELAEQQGLEFTRDGYQLSPRALRLFQSKLLETIFSDLQAARSGRHTGAITGEGAVELPRTKPYEFGDSMAHMDITQSLINAMIREGASEHKNDRPRVAMRDIDIHQTRNTPKCATAVIMDMSGSMRYDGLYVHAKRMALALDGLIRREYPGDFLQFIEMYTFAKPRHVSELPELMPKPVTIQQSRVHLRADMSDERLTEMDIPHHFTNIQHALQMARRFLTVQDTPNRQIVLITDGLPTAHFEGNELYLLYPPHQRTEDATMREAHLAARENITINVFLLPNWSQTHEDVQFAQRMVEATGGRVFFVGGSDLDRYVVWDYVTHRRSIIA